MQFVPSKHQRHRACTALAVGTSLLLGASMAGAQSVGVDIVQLQNGGRLQGTVLIHEPGVRTVVRLPDGSTRTLPASEVREVVRAQQTVVPVPAPVAVTPVGPPLHVESPIPVRVGRYVLTGSLDALSMECCVSPCDRAVPRGVPISIEGDAMPAATFALPYDTTAVRVTPGQHNTLGVVHGLGIAVMAVGVTAVLIGVILAPVAIVARAVGPSILGFGLTLGGVGMIVGGVFMLRANNAVPTHVDDEHGRRLAHPSLTLPALTIAF